MKHISLFVITILLLSFSINARQLSPQEALSRISVPQIPEKSLLSVESRIDKTPIYIASTDDVNTLYVFQRGEAGFLVVSADDVVSQPLLGYTDSGSFDASDSTLMWWLGQYSKEIVAATRWQGINGDESRVEVYADLAPIEPLVTSYWNQLSPYNDLIPYDGTTRCPVGCVAVAVAQVMNYYKYPTTGTGSVSYRSTHIDSIMTLDLSAVTFDWAAMKSRYVSGENDESSMAVANLMHAVSLAVHTQFTAKASSTNFTTASKALLNNFNYDKGMRHLTRDYFELPEWIDIIYGELAAGRPVLYGGTNSAEGHAFVCDGYSTDGYFHINWGWGGMSNGYFQLTALNPEEQGIGGCTGAYNIGQNAVVGIQPPVEGSKIEPVVQFVSDFMVDSLSYKRVTGGNITVSDSRGIFNHTIATTSLTFGLKLTDLSSGETQYVAAPQPKRLVMGQAIRSYTVAQSEFPEQGHYMVTPAVESENGEWFDAGVLMSCTREYLLDCTPDSLSFQAVGIPAITATGLTLTSPLIAGVNFSVVATLTNPTEEEFLETVRPVLWRENEEITTATPMEVDILGGESIPAEWVSKFAASITPGSYTLSLIDSKGHTLCRPIEVTLMSKPTEQLAMTASDAVVAATDSVRATMQLHCSSGYFADRIKAFIYNKSGAHIKTVESMFVGIVGGETREVTFADDLGVLEDGHSYTFMPLHNGTPMLTTPVEFVVGKAAASNIVADSNASIEMSVTGRLLTVKSHEPLTCINLFTTSGVLVTTIHPSESVNMISIELGELSPGIYVVQSSPNRTGASRMVVLN